MSFEDNITIESILQKFASEFNIPLNIVSESFNTHAINIEFSNSLYLESTLKTELKNIGVDVSRENIDAKKGSVVASPGEISRGPFVQTLYAGLEITDYVLILQSDYHSLYGNGIKSEDKGYKSEQSDSLQQIFYGAPGTGKSHTINEKTKDEDVIRTTFHPDTDYSTFVGAYKPTTKEVDLRDLSGHKVVENGEVVKEDRIVYEFVAQSFLQAYVSAWKKYADANEDEPQKQYLVIEEINRGNCAQIFGDLFQLLDRNDRGFSDYPIKADADMKRQLQKAFAGLLIAQKDKINAMYEGKDIVSQVLNGDILLLPNNLYIWATMNTSDQSLFPIDSAFKRRWDWTYMPISDAEKNWIIEVDGNNYDWWQFLEKINEKIGSTTNSEDKKLGYFFCKAQDGVISAKTFVGKVIFYLWNDVFKDYEFGDAIFNDEDGSKLSFDKFYTSEGTKYEIVEEKVELFLKNLGIAPLDMDLVDNVDDFASNKNDLTRYSFDGKSKLTKAALGLSIMEKYLSEHKELNYEEIKTTFPDSMLGKISHARLIVEASENLQSYSRYYTGIYKTSDNKEFKIYKQWTRGNIQNMIDFANQQGWSVNIE